MVLYWVLWVLMRLIGRVLFQLRIAGQHFIPKQGGVLIAANHASYLDIPILGSAIPRRACFLGRMDLFSGPVAAVMRYLGWIPIRRERVDRKGFDEAIRRLRDGEAVVIYPEGGRSEDGQLRQGKPGIALLLAASGCPVIPALLEGTYEALPPGARWIRLRPIRVTFGPPMDFSARLRDLEGEELKAVYQEISQEVMENIAALGKPDSARPGPLAAGI
jgi:1-acyl-sn-glycerol-3-phosphate acyltransferase